ncbi:peptide chain release factor N(5)-glutamine methyltransferase [Bdellovibrio bacteriovorus]|uniref:peptide chain release factor N(5)-glutamine methyltransferase n=1 Tax=Bdellovibrio bacteriovorus TaxID=959 RepID=UPI00045C0564|nr:peptide chain release factor N(5)-glutamine methyltransferase [Bdellovibrio bacteriovorus]AHZ85726.1 modification methylase HemK [Bdellovibrio bacteriovorus]BEV66645.1 Release factor glutamine methyltransferase [Bdellovibrio bacteriovorus]
MKLKEILDKTTAFFKDKKIDTPRLDAELLLAHGLKLERIQLYLRFDQPMKDEELAVLRELVRRRASGEPVAYILGYRDFFNHRFEVNNQVLIPRPETEHIVEDVLAWASDKEASLGLIDLGCGSGCIGLSLLKEYPNAKLIAVDLLPGAIEVAQRNAQSLDVADRVQFLNLDAGNVEAIMSAYKDFTGQSSIDVLVSNPPYIASDDPQVEENVKKFEPNSALYAEDSGLALLKGWSKAFAPYLKTPGLMLMEMGMSQGPAMKQAYESLKIFNEISVIKDLSGHDRVIRGETHG